MILAQNGVCQQSTQPWFTVAHYARSLSGCTEMFSCHWPIPSIFLFVFYFLITFSEMVRMDLCTLLVSPDYTQKLFLYCLGSFRNTREYIFGYFWNILRGFRGCFLISWNVSWTYSSGTTAGIAVLGSFFFFSSAITAGMQFLVS